MKYFKIIIFLNLLLFLYSCGSIKEGFSNQKKNNSDEFLVEKKSPLVMPPDYNELPLPDESKVEINSDNNIKKLVTNNDDISKNSGDLNQSFEKSLIEKIKKN
tara:strand:+ start:741 stop:1049 length:309 start_codon:yes stop_codon:yes gene_type:complete